MTTREMVSRSLLLADTTAERHGVYGRHPVVTGEQSVTKPRERPVPTRVQAPGSEETRDAGCPPASSTTCGHARGDHKDSGSRSLSAAAIANALGICLIKGCDCARYEEAPVPVRVAGAPRIR